MTDKTIKNITYTAALNVMSDRGFGDQHHAAQSIAQLVEDAWNRRSAAQKPAPAGELVVPDQTDIDAEADRLFGVADASPSPADQTERAKRLATAHWAASCQPARVNENPDDIWSDMEEWERVAWLSAARAVDPAPSSFQQRIHDWMLACFGAEIAADKLERNHRFLEEALELVQACGCTQGEAHQLVDYVFGRPVGEPAQEVGGVMVTLAALCHAQGIDMAEAGETELARVWTKVEAIRAKQASKPKGSPLPAVTAPEKSKTERALDAAREFLRACNSAWAAGEPSHRVGDMLKAADVLESALGVLEETPTPQSTRLPIGYFSVPLPVPGGLHPDTVDLVVRFAGALAAKLRLDEVKHGFTDEWARPGWRDQLIADLLAHVYKGDPRDVAAYCAFAWHHGWNVAPELLAPDAEKLPGHIRAALQAAWELSTWTSCINWRARDRDNRGEWLDDLKVKIEQAQALIEPLLKGDAPHAAEGWAGTLGSITNSEEPGGPMTVTLTMDTLAPKWVTFQAVWDALRVEVRPLPSAPSTSAGEAK